MQAPLLVSTEWLAAHLRDVRIVDVRWSLLDKDKGRALYEEGHIPGAVHVPRGNLESRIENAVPDRGRRIVVYCASGPCQNSGIAARRLAALGYSDVSDYHEGKAEWIAAGLPVEAGAPAAAGAPAG